MEDTEANNPFEETYETQFDTVQKLTSLSPVMKFGDFSYIDKPIANNDAYPLVEQMLKMKPRGKQSIANKLTMWDSRDVKLNYLQNKVMKNGLKSNGLSQDEAQSIIGYAGVFAPGQTEADILTVGVVPEHRGKGIAKALMALITDWANTQGSTAMMLEVKTDNLEAIGLYESLGYSKLNVRKDYYGAGLVAQVMRLELS